MFTRGYHRTMASFTANRWGQPISNWVPRPSSQQSASVAPTNSWLEAKVQYLQALPKENRWKRGGFIWFHGISLGLWWFDGISDGENGYEKCLPIPYLARSILGMVFQSGKKQLDSAAKPLGGLNVLPSIWHRTSPIIDFSYKISPVMFALLTIYPNSLSLSFT